MAASSDGSLTILKNGKSSDTIKLQGYFPLVRLINGEIVTAARWGKLTILNEKLQVLKSFDGTENSIRTLARNEKYIAYGDWSGAVRYYSRNGGMAPKVSRVYTVIRQKTPPRP